MDGEQRKGKGRQIGGVGRGRVSIPDGSGALGLCRSHILKNKRGRHPPQQRHTGRSPPGPPDPSCRHSPSSSLPPPLHGGCSSPGWPGGAAMGSNTKLGTWCGVRINRQMTNHRSPLVTWLHPSLSLKSLLGQMWGLFRGEHGKGAPSNHLSAFPKPMFQQAQPYYSKPSPTSRSSSKPQGSQVLRHH